MEKPVVEESHDVDWHTVIKAVTRYAYAKVRIRRRVLGRMGIPVESEADDYVQEAIKGYFSGPRTWNREAYPTMEEFLKSVIDSKMSNWGRSRAFKEQQVTDHIDDEADAGPGGDHRNVERDRRVESELYRIVDDDERAVELYAVLEGYLDGDKRSEIAEEWGMTPDQVTNAKKRLDRKIEREFSRDLLDELGLLRP